MAQRDRVLFIGDYSEWSEDASEYVKSLFPNTTTLFWERKHPERKSDAVNLVDGWKGDYIISFKSDLVLTEKQLKNAEKAAINFHPSLPDYRGIGGYYYAIQHGKSQFGVTCHHMIREIDAGPIIQVNRFAINPNENYLALRSRTGPKCHRLLTDIVGILANDGDVPKSNEVWGPRLYKLAELPPEVQIALTDVAVPTKPAPIASTRRTAPAPKHAVNE